ncbi:MAG TPA: peptidoglycan DD-metalloendopeptidase family protein [Saprospiraceae bacterium]|nr:peptidoglycan DD-metalloendopeptidase family protein [Saprospiraceae bacterium]
MRRSTRILGLLVLLLFIGQIGQSQSRKDLEKQRLKIIKDIEKTSKELERTKQTKEKNLTQLKALEQQMDSRKKLISNLEAEVKLNEKTIASNTETIEVLKKRHNTLKDQYSTLLRSSYLKKMTNSKWSYLLSSENLNNLMLRWRYMHQFDHFTKQKVEEIKTITGEIQSKNEEIEKTKVQNLTNLDATSKNIVILEKEQKEKDQIVQKLSKEEEKLKVSLKKREKERENLNASIERVILAELSKAKEKEKGDAAVVKKKEIDNSGFSKNKGALSWPVSKGKITGKFGTHPHPTIKGIDVSNNGVDFTLPSGDKVECVYDGEVVGVTTIPGFKNMVIIKHGSYYSVYSKLDNVNVSKGQKIKRGQSIGQVTTDEDGKAELHFELWKDKAKLDPQKWFNR